MIALITLEQLITSVVEKKNNLNEQNFEVYRKSGSEIRGSRMEDGTDRESGIGGRESVKNK